MQEAIARILRERLDDPSISVSISKLFVSKLMVVTVRAKRGTMMFDYPIAKFPRTAQPIAERALAGFDWTRRNRK